MKLQNPNDFRKSLNESSNDLKNSNTTIIANYSMNIVDNYPPDSSEDYKKYRKLLLEDEDGRIQPADIMPKEYLENVDKVCMSYVTDVATKFNIEDKIKLSNIIGTLWWEYWFGEGLTSSDTRSVAGQLTKILNVDSATNESVDKSNLQSIIADIIQSEIYLRDVPYSMSDEKDMEVDPDSIIDAAKAILAEISPMLNESHSLNEEYEFNLRNSDPSKGPSNLTGWIEEVEDKNLLTLIINNAKMVSLDKEAVKDLITKLQTILPKIS